VLTYEPRKGRWRRTLSGSLLRLTIWVLLLATWEAAYRVVGWRDYLFPAPSHILDSMLDMLNVKMAFGDPLRPRWPLPQHVPSATEQQGAAAYRAGRKLQDNPNPPYSTEAVDWTRGYQDASHSWWDSQLVRANLVSAARLLTGFGLSIGLGTTLGLLMWRWRPLDEFLGPLFLGLQTLPSVCWVPLGMLTFGINETGILFVLIMGSFFAVAIAMRDGLRTIPPLYQQAGQMLGARGWRLYSYVLLPASLPALASSLRQGFSFAWRSLMGAELIMVAVSAHGLGYLLSIGREQTDVARVIAVMIIMVLIGMAADRWLFAPLQRGISARFGLTGAHG
jgi:NitT/TauT family transport system permease protein